LRTAYVVKRYPRYSETFIVNEILAHEQAGWEIEIFSLRPPVDTHFQDCIARVRAPVTYLYSDSSKAELFWSTLCQAKDLPGMDSFFEITRGVATTEVQQAVKLACEATRRGVQHLHAHFASSATTVARVAAALAKISFTFTAHAKDIFHESVDAEELRRNLRAAAATITVSDFNVAYLRDSFGASAARLRRIYNGIHLDRFAFRPAEDRPPKIVAVGRLIEKKGFGDLIDACALLARDAVEFQCEIIGEGESAPRLQAQIRRLGLLERVRLLGPRPQAEVIERVQSAAVCPAPCVVGADGNRDGLPTVILEAMALGTPCISTDVTGIPEILRDGETGLMVSQRNPADLAKALRRLLHDAPLRQRIAAAARALIERDFDIQRNAALLREVFREASLAGPWTRRPRRRLQEVS
jgi:glycosyltransferase involved in cell wall biosynthesis